MESSIWLIRFISLTRSCLWYNWEGKEGRIPMSNNHILIRLGPNFLIKKLETLRAICAEDAKLHEFMMAAAPSAEQTFLYFLISHPSMPSLYCVFTERGLTMAGITTRTTSDSGYSLDFHRPSKKMVSIYRDICSESLSREVNPSETKMGFGRIQQIPIFPSIAVIGVEKLLRKVLMNESLQKKEMITIAGFFSEDTGQYILRYYNRWVTPDYRVDFFGDQVALSLSFPPSWASRERLEIFRTISNSLTSVLSYWHPEICPNTSQSITAPDQGRILITLWISLKQLPHWISKFEPFQQAFKRAVLNTLDLYLVDFKGQWGYRDQS